MRRFPPNTYLYPQRLVLIIILIIAGLNSAKAQAPTITGFSPASICQGETITITGTNFTGATIVKVGNYVSNFSVNTSGTVITVNIPVTSANGVIQITTPDGTVNSATSLIVLAAPTPVLADVSNPEGPFTNCNGNLTYEIKVRNESATTGSGNVYTINWGDGSPLFTQTDWPAGAQISHTYNSQGYFPIGMTITPANRCTRSVGYLFYNGKNPIASLSTSSSTTGLCAPASIEFQIGNWSGNSPGTKYDLDFGDGSPHVILQHPLSAPIHKLVHEYIISSCPDIDFTATLNVINGCFTTTYTLNQIVIRKKPVANFSINPSPSCINVPIRFTNETTSGYSGNSCSRTSVFLWNFGDGTTSTDENPPSHQYPRSGTYDVTLIASNNACGSDTKIKQIVIAPISPPPVVAVTSAEYCEGEPATQLTATGVGLLWYTPGGNVVTVAPTPSTASGGTFTYYVSQTKPNNCESPKVAVTVIVHALPAAPRTAPVNLCQGKATSALTATGSGLIWYTNQPGDVGSSIAPTPSTASVGNTTYYVSQKINGCEGPKATILVTVNPLAQAPVVTTPITYCQDESAATLTATGTNLFWYTTATGGLSSSSAPVPSTAIPGDKIYYVSQTTICGEGPRAAITVHTNPGSSASISYTPSLLCNSASSQIPVILNGTAGGTYSISPANGLTIDQLTGAISPFGARVGTYTIRYFIPGTGGCANVSATATVTVNGAPTATISYPDLCSADAPTSVIRSGTPGGTFASSTGLDINANTGVINPSNSTPGDYIVKYTIAASPPCAGFSTTAPVKITKAPFATIAYSTTNLCNTSTAPLLVTFSGTTGGTYSITPAGLSIDATTGTINPSNPPVGIYTIKYFIPGTTGCGNFSTTATVIVSGAPTATISYPDICTADALTNVNRKGSSGGTYASTTGLDINTITGVINPSNSTPGDYIVKYTIIASPPCAGFSTTAPVKITKAPFATIAYRPAILCNSASAPVAVTLTGTPNGQYSITPAGMPIDAITGAIDPSGVTPGRYTIRYAARGTGGCGNFSTTTTVIVSGAPTATISYPGSPYCGAVPIPQAVSLSGTQGGIFSSDNGLSINTTTGAINPYLSAPGTYTVTYTIAALPPCPGYVTTTTVRIDERPVITFPIPEQSICSGETAVFVPSSTLANTTYTWSVSLPPNVAGIVSGTSSGPISLSFTNTGNTLQSLKIRVIPTNPSQPPCPGAAYELTLLVKPATPPPVTDTANFCMGNPPAALSVSGTDIKWYDENGLLLNAAPVISTTNPHQFKYYVTQTNSYGCESPKSEIVAIVHPTAKIISSTSINPTICGVPSGSIILHVLDLNDNPIPDIPILVHYNKFQLSHTYSGNTDATGTITIPLTAGTYTNISVESKGGCTSQKIPDIFILKDPTPPEKPVAGYNPPICNATPLTLTALTATEVHAGPIDYVWAGPAFGPYADTVKTTVITFPSASVSDAGTYVVYAIQNNCISLPASFEIQINQSPTKPTITTRTPLCIGDNLFLQAYSSIPGDGVLNYTWNGPGTGFPVNAPNAAINKVKIEDAGMYAITVTSAETGCSVTSDTLIQVGGYPIVKFGQDTISLPTGYRFIMAPVITNATDPGILPIQRYTWTPSQDLDCNDALCSSPVATIKNNTCYNVEVTNIYGCSGSDTLCVNVFCKNSQVFIPNAFAPGGSVPENKKLVVRATGISTVKSFRIFNRWGKILFERDNFSPNSTDFGWDGMVNGKLADTGVYIYTVEVICENGVPYTFKGNVTLF